MIYVDSNVVIDILACDPQWFVWASERMEEFGASDLLVTGPVVAAEVGHYLDSAATLGRSLEKLKISLVDADLEAAFLAGRAYREYRRRGGDRPSLLPDFLIGAHAMAIGAAVLSRDTRRFRSYFPELKLISPKESK